VSVPSGFLVFVHGGGGGDKKRGLLFFFFGKFIF
jgi:hypothetical protein